MTNPRARAQRTRRPGVRLLAVLLPVLVLAACAAGPLNATVAPAELAGFWQGLWHGFISPVTFVISLFTDDVSIYEVHNNGNWYDAGFMLGISSVFSGSARSGARRAPRRRPEVRDAP